MPVPGKPERKDNNPLGPQQKHELPFRGEVQLSKLRARWRETTVAPNMLLAKIARNAIKDNPISVSVFGNREQSPPLVKIRALGIDKPKAFNSVPPKKVLNKLTRFSLLKGDRSPRLNVRAVRTKLRTQFVGGMGFQEPRLD